MPVTAFYAALLAVIFVGLSLRVIFARGESGTLLGDGGNPELQRRIRVHGNFSEYVPFAIILLGLAEGLGAPHVLLHVLGLTLLAGRLAHALGVSRPPEVPAIRVVAMGCTLTMMVLSAMSCLVLALRHEL
jgi:hypothetical protein